MDSPIPATDWRFTPAHLTTFTTAVPLPKSLALIVGEYYVHETLHTTGAAFAAKTFDGRVVTWGCRESGGDSRAVQHQLTGVVSICANKWAFAATRDDGRVVTWGHLSYGGDSSSVSDELVGVVELMSLERTFRKLSPDCRCVWTSSADEDTNWLDIEDPFGSAFVARLADGEIVAWGDREWLDWMRTYMLCLVEERQNGKETNPGTSIDSA